MQQVRGTTEIIRGWSDNKETKSEAYLFRYNKIKYLLSKEKLTGFEKNSLWFFAETYNNQFLIKEIEKRGIKKKDGRFNTTRRRAS